MDKPEKQETITIKINGKDRPVIEENKSRKNSTTKENKESDVVFRRINHVNNKEIQIFERVDDETSSQTAAAKDEKGEKQFDWILPDLESGEEIKEYTIASKPKFKKRKYKTGYKKSNLKTQKKKLLPSVLFNIFFAVLLGTSMGLFMLFMVKTETAPETAMETGITPSDETKPPTEENVPGNLAIDLKGITAYVVQGGAFSATESAEAEKASISELGVPVAVAQMEDMNYIFVGAADNLDHAKVLGEQLESKGVSNFAKEVNFGGTNKEELLEAEKKLLEIAPSMYETISSISSSALVSNTTPSEVLERFTKLSEEWSHLDQNDIKAKELQGLKQEMDEAVNHAKSYLEKSQPNLNEEIQQSLLNFLVEYHSL